MATETISPEISSHEIVSHLITHCAQLVVPGAVFVAIAGKQHDGISFVAEALDRGAREIIIEKTALLPPELVARCAATGVGIVRVPNTRRALAERSAELYGHPAQQLTMLGITGTKGKTTTSWLLFHILHATGYRTALLSTVENRIGANRFSTKLTTQHPDYLHAFMRQAVEAGVTHVVLEVAAQAVSLHRVAGISYDRLAWLNFSQEHGEFYTTPQDYWHAKAELFTRIAPRGIGFVPQHSSFDQLASLAPNTASLTRWHHVPGTAVPRTAPATSLTERTIQCTVAGVTYTCPQLLGTYNEENLTVAVLMARSLQLTPELIQHSLHTFGGVPGRLNFYPLSNGALGCIDYAHNAASFEATLGTLRAHTDQLIVVFGAGGERDPARRPTMGAIARKYAHAVILTTDNPRSEDPTHICTDILAGIAPEERNAVHVVLDREAAIKQAFSQSTSGSIIALLGKGPDEYQLIQGQAFPFSEREILAQL